MIDSTQSCNVHVQCSQDQNSAAQDFTQTGKSLNTIPVLENSGKIRELVKRCNKSGNWLKGVINPGIG